MTRMIQEPEENGKQKTKIVIKRWKTSRPRMFFNILLLFIFILLVCYYHLHYGRNGRLINLIPGPKGYPIIGYLWHSYGSQVSTEFLIYLHYLTYNPSFVPTYKQELNLLCFWTNIYQYYCMLITYEIIIQIYQHSSLH